MAATRLHDLAAIIDDLDAMGRLARVTSVVDARHELAGIAKSLEGGPRAVLFETVKGHRWPVLAGLFGNRGLLAELLQQEEPALARHIADAIGQWQRAPIEPVIVAAGPVLEVTEKGVDLGTLPIPVLALKDGGPSFDAIVVAKDPETSLRELSIQRFQVTGRDTLGLGIDSGSRIGACLEMAGRLGRSLWVTLNCGVGPSLHVAASIPAEVAPTDSDVLGLSGELDGAALELAAGTESDVEMVAAAMWALECEVVPGEAAPRGPSAEATGLYAPAGPAPVVHVRRVHRRARPVFQVMVPGLEMWNAAGMAGEAHVLALLRRQVPGILDVHFTPGGAGCHHAVVQISPRRAGSSKQAVLAAFAAFPPLKMVTVVDDEIDIRDPHEVEWAVAMRLDPAGGIVRIDNAPGHGLYPAFHDDFGPKLGFDATQPLTKGPQSERVAFKPVSLDQYEIAGRDAAPASRPKAPPAPKSAAPPSKPNAVPTGDYDTDRIWQRELAEWKKDGADMPSAPGTPPTGADWDENRWWKRELAAMQLERAKPPAVPAKAAPAQPAHSLDPAPRAAVVSAPPRKSSDWDEDRWWKREMEEMKRGGPKPERAAPVAKPVAHPPAPPRTPTAAKPEPGRIAGARPAERQQDDDDGGFFHNGTA